MLKKRIIPIIYFSGTNQIQSVGFNRPHRIIGDLVSAVKIMDKRLVDELVLIDVDASIYGVEPNFKLIEKLANEIYCPFTVGGGVRNYSDVRNLLLAGADKVAIQSLCYADPASVNWIINRVGAQSIMMSVDIKPTSNIENQIRLINKINPGEVLLTSVENNGTLQGYDLDTLQTVADAVPMPVVANGGAGHPDHFVEALKAAHAVAASSMWLFTDWTPRSAAQYLKENNIEVRV